MTISLSFSLRFRLQTISLLVLMLGTGLVTHGQSGATPAIRYVRVNGTNNNPASATTWATSTTNLQGAINASNPGDQVWVAAGIYKPGGNTNTDRTISFTMKNGVTIYGGFAGSGSPTLAQRNPTSFTTVLSGDIGTLGSNTDNSYHVFYHPFGTNLNSSAVLDGFVIRDGNSGGQSFADYASGMYNDSSNPTVTNCSFQNNSGYYGAGMSNTYNSNPTVTNCSFLNNSSTAYGGGMYNDESSPVLTNCSFQGNSALEGGGMSNGGGSLILTNCSFQSNSATRGGVMVNYSTVSLTNCVVFGNGEANTISNVSGSLTASYSLFETSVTGYIDGGNNLTTSTSPFVSATDAQLNGCSLAINTGLNSANATTTDLAGNPRLFNNSRIDRGAYEYQAAPTIITTTAPSVSTATRGQSFSQTFTASGGSGPYSYSLVSGSLPPGLSLATTGVLSGTPTQAGSFTLTLLGQDATGCSGVSAAYVLTVINATLTLTGLAPVRNARSAPLATNVSLTFNQALSNNAATLGGLRVFSAQRGGLLRNGQGGSTSVSGSTLSFNPATNFRPGETVFVTSTTAIQGTGGGRLSQGQVYQFTTEVGGSGQGNFTRSASNPNLGVGSSPVNVAVGDVDGDGDLDLLTANLNSNTVSVRLNNGSGNFTAPATNPEPGVGSRPYSVAVGDVDGDGDLDLLCTNFDSSTVSVRLNDGSGNFTAPATNPNPGVGRSPISVAVGDVDGDGDLDLLTANLNSNNVSVRLNDGSGNFTAPATNPEPGVGTTPYSVALGDVDGDGDLDLLTANLNSSTVSVRLNDGSGNFTAPATNPNPGVGRSPISVAVGDVDGDGDLDLLCVNAFSDATVSVRLNDGRGNFTPPATNPEVAVGAGPASVALGDVDGDGNLDLLTANSNSGSVSVRLNNGTGNFTPPATNPNPGADFGVVSVALGDVDGDGDLDLLTANQGSNNVSVRLNDPLPPLTLTDLSASPNPVCVGQPLSVRARVGNFSGSYSYTLSNGSTPISGSATMAAFSQTLTATGSGVQAFTLTVSSEDQLATAITSVTVNAPPSPTLISSGTLTCASPSVTLTAGGGNSYTFASGSERLGTPGPANSVVVSSTGTYSVTVASASGCVSTTSITVERNAEVPSATLSASPSSTLTCAQTSLTLTAGGGGTYAFSGGTVSGNQRVVSTAGVYSVTVSNGNGCTAVASTSVSADQSSPSASITPSNATLTCGTPSVSLTAVGTGSVRWDDNSTAAIRTVSSARTYSVTLTSSNGCTAVASAVVSADQGTPSVNISPSSAALTCAMPTVSLTAVGTGSVRWSTGETTPVISVSVSRTYSVTLTGENACMSMAQATVSGTADAPAAPILQASTLTTTNQPITVTASGCSAGVINWTALGGLGQASGNTYSLTQPGNYTLSASCSLNGCTSSSSAPMVLQIQPGGFAITGVSMVSCELIDEAKQGYQVRFTPQYSGADNTPISFSVVNELLPTTQPAPYSLRLYTDNPTITLVASQADKGEARFAYNWLASCQSGTSPNQAPTTAGIPAQTLLQGQPYQLQLTNYFADPDGQALTFSAQGLPAGLSLNGSLISGTPSVSGVSSVTITALDPGGLAVSSGFPLRVNPAPTTPSSFSLVRVTTVSCEVVSAGLRRVSFTPQYTGLDGSPVSFSVVNEKLPTTEPGPYMLNLYTDNPAITLSAQQGPSISTYVYNWLVSCQAGGRVGSLEPGTGLKVQLLGNPVLDNQLKLEVRGAQGQPLRLSLIDERGRIIQERVVEPAGAIEHPTLGLGSQPTGLLLLRVSTPSQSQTLKVLKR